MVTHVKPKVEEFQNSREGEIYVPRMCQGDSSRTKVDCGSTLLKSKKTELLKGKVDSLKDRKSLLLTQSFAMLLSAHQPGVQCALLSPFSHGL